MAVWAEVIDTNFNFLGIDIYQTLKDGELVDYVAKAQEGYVFYDPNANDTEYDRETDTETPVTRYHIVVYLPKMYYMGKFPYKAVPRDSVDEKYIF